MSPFKYYLNLKTGQYLYIDIFYFILCIFLTVLTVVLFLSRDYRSIPNNYLLNAIQNILNFRQITIPFTTAFILVPLLGTNFAQLFFWRSPVPFFKVQIFYYFVVQITAIIVGLLISAFIFGKTDINVNNFIFFLIGIYLMYKLIFLFYIVSGNKIIGYILTYTYLSLELYLQKYHINLLVFHYMIRSEKKEITFTLFNNVIFFFCFYGILEVFTRWILTRKNFIAIAVG